MPRFTEKEKAFISDKLLAEGEKLFSLHGLKKVTVDDLAAVSYTHLSYRLYRHPNHIGTSPQGECQTGTDGTSRRI